MRSEAIIIVGARFQNSAQMHLAQDNDVVHTFTLDRSDQPFAKSIPVTVTNAGIANAGIANVERFELRLP